MDNKTKKKGKSPAIDPKQTDARVDVFAQAIHRGESQSDAYREMHPISRRWKNATVHVKASKWAKNDKVLAKVKQLQELSAKRNETTIDTIDKMHKAAFAMANKNKQPAAMTQAAQNLAKLHGLIEDKNVTKIQPDPSIVRKLSDFYAEES